LDQRKADQATESISLCGFCPTTREPLLAFGVGDHVFELTSSLFPVTAERIVFASKDAASNALQLEDVSLVGRVLKGPRVPTFEFVYRTIEQIEQQIFFVRSKGDPSAVGVDYRNGVAVCELIDRNVAHAKAGLVDRGGSQEDLTSLYVIDDVFLELKRGLGSSYGGHEGAQSMIGAGEDLISKQKRNDGDNCCCGQHRTD
jgi:hypothetical protein